MFFTVTIHSRTNPPMNNLDHCVNSSAKYVEVKEGCRVNVQAWAALWVNPHTGRKSMSNQMYF